MSPERLNGAERSAANDIWSVGATLVHMIIRTAIKPSRQHNAAVN